ncbi:glycosyltransferase family 2 protein [Acetobacter estunensis]|uniref:glycosyltransferase family 2 protein n=1 Tax=Acetobacter estunensis TaxID=104097 RepID=UPI001C2D780B|nr:glycosyltransferase family 2 protein [Acetobacter estunensis]MBV1835698.1 glycosyltransferase family 2 protein [Acetobacter estunensis]MBV1836041.1 glycosyltransferase family 2 protein [Acetobacter estunensis]
MARVRCLMMQRDEPLLLEAWFRHHGYLFGFENLTVFDNGSIDPAIPGILDTYERAGATIHRGHDRPDDFIGRAQHFENVIRHWDAEGDYDFALMLNCDDFLATFTDAGLSCARSAIDKAFDAFLGEKSTLVMPTSLMNVPERPGCFMLEDRRRNFIAAGTLGHIDQGLAGTMSGKSEEWCDTPFTCLHMSNRPIEARAEQARQRLGVAEKAPADSRRTLAQLDPYARENRHLTMTAARQLAAFSKGVFVQFPAFVAQLRALGITTPFLVGDAALPTESTFGLWQVAPRRKDRFTPFDGNIYTEHNPDVAAVGTPPLRHYLSHGHAEGRRVRTAEDEETFTPLVSAELQSSTQPKPARKLRNTLKTRAKN